MKIVPVARTSASWAVLAALGAFVLVLELSQPMLVVFGAALGIAVSPASLGLALAIAASTGIAWWAGRLRPAVVAMTCITVFAIALPTIRTARDLADCMARKARMHPGGCA